VKEKKDASKIVSISPATELPKELEGKTTLTAKQKKKDCAYRDRMFLLNNSAARLSPDEQTFAAAVDREEEYIRRLERLLPQEGKLRGERKKQHERALYQVTDDFTTSLFIQGKYAEAVEFLRLYATEPARVKLVKDKIAFYESVIRAIYKPDGQHCKCPATNFKTECRIYIPERARFVDLVACLCGHRNATERLPEQVVKAERAKLEVIATYGNDATDSHIQRFGRDR
jgi:hypothetical protein